jgi:hypothetical protein
MEAVAARAVEPVPTRRGGPYVGPRPFEGRDKMFFFGRERAAQELAHMVAACALTVVYGPSGAGKSSLLNTRLLDELIRIESDWLSVMFIRWQPGFETALRAALDEALDRGPGEVPLDGYAKALQETVRTTRSPIVLVFDQFEEYFLYHGTGTPWFEILLAQLANARERGVHVVLSLRSDRLFLLDRLRRRIPHILQNLFLIDPLNAAGSADAIRKPVQSYNRHFGATIGVEPTLVDAVVRGADEQQIFQRLPFRGRGKAPPRIAANATEAATAAPQGRIVAPFLQLALEALWEEDIVECGGTMLTLATLRTLTGAAADVPDDALVGLLAQRHLDTVLFNRPAAEQAICATVFDRMVTYSGGKVAVAVPGDFSALLDPEQQQAAAALLDELSVPGPDCLVRRVATEGQRQGQGASEQIEERYEIVHDALAVPILDWVTRWREDQARRKAEEKEKAAAAARDAQRARKLRIWRRVAIAGVAVLVIVRGLMAYNDRVATMTRIANFTRFETQPQFRLRLLLGLAFLAQADWPLQVVLAKEPVRETLRNTLLRSPRQGGTLRGAGLNEAGTQLASLVSVDPTAAQVQVTMLGDGGSKLIEAPAELADASPRRRRSRCRRSCRHSAGPRLWPATSPEWTIRCCSAAASCTTGPSSRRGPGATSTSAGIFPPASRKRRTPPWWN